MDYPQIEGNLMAESGVEPNLRTYLMVLRRRMWWIVTIVLLGLGASLAMSSDSAEAVLRGSPVAGATDRQQSDARIRRNSGHSHAGTD